jgi:hypothetical protein
MTLRNHIFSTVALIFLLLMSACGSHTESVTENKPVTKNDKDEFHQILDSSNKLVFKRYDLSADSNLLQDLDKVLWQDTINAQDKIKKFNKLFSFVENGGYCCCMKTHYTVSFFNDKDSLGTYYIDTADIKDKIVLFGQSYQTSYIIKLKDLHAIILDK